MSENAKKRIAIVMARDNGAFKSSQRLSAGVIHHRLETHFPNHHYNLMSVKLYLLRLFEAGLVQPGQRGGPPIYHLTDGGYEAAQDYWKIRDELGYHEAPFREAVGNGPEPDHGLLRIAEGLLSAGTPV